MISISVVIPVYNSAEILPDLVKRLLPVLKEHTSQYEVILVNDGSKDNSWKTIEQHAHEHDALHGINLMSNYGQHNALLVGLRAAKMEYTVTMDDDLQNPPEEIPKLIAAIEKDGDVIYGVPESQQHSAARNLGSILVKFVLNRAMGVENARKVNAFRILRTQLRDAFTNYNGSFVSLDLLLSWGTQHFGSVKVRHDKRHSGSSNYTWKKLFNHAFDVITGFSIVPLQLASLLGLLFTFLGVLLFIYVMGNYMVNGAAVPGFTFLATIIAVFSGVQLFALGIIGEYLARMHFRTMGKPYAVIREITKS
jgi:undecaprenyl-phosphate 4-deoxy-4-formamido-L-arabinose transferase